MKAGKSLGDELAVLMQRALLPPRFPVRRDLEVEAGISDGDQYVSFYDHLWLEPQVFGAIALRLHQPGLEGARAASALRQLIRALFAKLSDPAAVLAWFETYPEKVSFDAGVIRIDVATGLTSFATTGAASVGLAGRSGSSSALTLTAGDIVWLAAGDIPALTDGNVPIEGLEGLVDPALMQAGTGAGCAILYKSAKRSSTATTFVMMNEQAGIPPLLEDIGHFFSRQSLKEDDVAGLDVALDEILTNAVNYGFRDGNPHEILVALSVEPHRLVIEVRDDGAPFDPLSLPEPDLSVDLEHRQIGGLGMHFVRSLLDRVAYNRSNGWNVLTLEKQLPSAGRD